MSWSGASGPVLACALLCCEWSAELPSDPASWSPPRSDAGQVDAADSDDASTIDLACTSGALPPVDPALRASTATAISHASGVGCLKSCHAAEGGEALTKFAAAGTIYRSQTSRQPVGTGGIVEGVGGMSLTVDRCGNFYVVRKALTDQDIVNTQPFVQNPTFHKMEKLLTQQAVDPLDGVGSCNRLDCHDFSSKLKWGIYY